jgi:2-polyprenyl-3-methyl-5-hydroxy-6-metoxy-1,4-benzoquinol methylase
MQAVQVTTPRSRSLDSAHLAWDDVWRDREARAPWEEPEPSVLALLDELVARGAEVLDVGAGVGRHALRFARAGLGVVALDASREGIRQIRDRARASDLAVKTCVAAFADLPLRDGSFDHVLAWNVVYHGDEAIVRAALRECARVLRPDGTFQLTMLSKHHRSFGVGRRIGRDTFVDVEAADDKAHPHFYVDVADLTALVGEAGFSLVSVSEDDQQAPGSEHWTVLATRGP